LLGTVAGGFVSFFFHRLVEIDVREELVKVLHKRLSRGTVSPNIRCKAFPSAESRELLVRTG
jgi:hypothetical protein